MVRYRAFTDAQRKDRFFVSPELRYVRHWVPRLFAGAIFLLCGCGGGSSASSSISVPVSTATPVATASPSPSPPPSSSASTTLSTTSTTSLAFSPVAGGMSSTLVMPPASTTATLSMTFSASPPPSAPAIQGARRSPSDVGAPVTPLAYYTAQTSAAVTFGVAPGASLTMSQTIAGSEYLVLFDPSNAGAGWNPIAGPGTPPNGIPEGGNTAPLTLQQGVTYDLALVSSQAAVFVPTPVTVDISPLKFPGAGSAYAQTITVTQQGYTGPFTLAGSSCYGIVSADTTSSSSGKFTITPVAAGTCSFTVTGRGAQTTLPVSVTTVTVGGQ
jgi:hypothetical protein